MLVFWCPECYDKKWPGRALGLTSREEVLCEKCSTVKKGVMVDDGRRPSQKEILERELKRLEKQLEESYD
jgi:hypothetical protein